MADVTTVNALPMPQLADRANIETAVRPLALAVDTRLVARFGTLSARNSAIPSPVAGQQCWVTETGELYLYDGSTWVSARPRVLRPLALETRTSQTLVASTYLVMPVESFAAYKVKYWGVWAATVDHIGLRIKIVAPSGSVTIFGAVGADAESLVSYGSTSNYQAVLDAATDGLEMGIDAIATPGLYTQVQKEGVVFTGATAGNIVVYFAHLYPNPGQTLTQGAAFLEALKIA